MLFEKALPVHRQALGRPASAGDGAVERRAAAAAQAPMRLHFMLACEVGCAGVCAIACVGVKIALSPADRHLAYAT